ncbi:DUF2127 domain-containing protein [Bdellovibrio sp. HCB-162]|uniref:DUF2127 domain-containing protein n=1 Tax=Bdellovibrio sp. HCB-162 TaxID=3394234 RepID=UPI0039BD47AD
MSGLRWIAIAEALKGFLVLFGGLGLLEYVHLHLQHIGNILTANIGLNPEHQYSKALLRLFWGVNDKTIFLLALGIVAYSALRLVEAYGLWYERTWARWLGIISGGVYLPYEFYELFHRFSWIKVGITIVNIGVVIYLAINRDRFSTKEEKNAYDLQN